MVIPLQPGQRLIAFRIDDGPWMFDEELLHIWVQAGPATEGPEISSFDWKSAFDRFMKTQIMSRNGHSNNVNLRQENERKADCLNH